MHCPKWRQPVVNFRQRVLYALLQIRPQILGLDRDTSQLNHTTIPVTLHARI